jgi:hypothetical protein
MDFPAIISEVSGVVSSFTQSQPLVALIGLFILGFLIYRKPVFFISVLTLALLVAGSLYFIMSMSDSGVSRKKELIKKSMPADSFRLPAIQ